MTKHFFLKVLMIHLFAYKLVYASASSWAFQQIETKKARELARGRGSPVVVAVIDTGIDTNHPDLKEALWTNVGETGLDSSGKNKSNNGIDDDGNGYVDDVHGWNFVTNSPVVTDEHGHGTHIAGIIAGQNKNEDGIEGLAPEAKIMALKYYDSRAPNEANVRNSIRAFQYAVHMKAQIINYSGGGPGFNPEEEKILHLAEEMKILVVAAAGNDGVNTDKIKYFPADYPLRNILSVTALNISKKLPLYANFGARSVHIAAPGDQIRSALPNSSYGEMSGTSQATAFVTGVAAFLLSQNPQLSSPEILIEKIVAGGVAEKALEGKTLQSSRLNAARSLLMKSSRESAADFVFETSDEIPPQVYTLSSSSLDPTPTVRQGGLERNLKN